MKATLAAALHRATQIEFIAAFFTALAAIAALWPIWQFASESGQRARAARASIVVAYEACIRLVESEVTTDGTPSFSEIAYGIDPGEIHAICSVLAGEFQSIATSDQTVSAAESWRCLVDARQCDCSETPFAWLPCRDQTRRGSRVEEPEPGGIDWDFSLD